MAAEHTNEVEEVIACCPSSIASVDRERWLATGRRVYAAVEEVVELDDGYACRLPTDEASLLDAAAYIALDRRCCPFVRWALRVEPHDRGVWLEMRGSDAVKRLSRVSMETTDLLREDVARAAGFSMAERRAVRDEDVDDLVADLNRAV